MSNTHNTNKNTFKCTNPCSRIKRALGWLPSRTLSPVLCLASLSHNFIQWLTTFIPLWLPQRRTSPLFLKTGTGTFLHSSDVLSRCCHLVQTHQECAFPLLTVFSALQYRTSENFGSKCQWTTVQKLKRTEGLNKCSKSDVSHLTCWSRVKSDWTCAGAVVVLCVFLPGWIKYWVGLLCCCINTCLRWGCICPCF